MTKLIMFVLLLLGSAGHAFAQWGQCDPLNREYFQTYDSLDYPTVDSICAYPPQPQPVNNCWLLGTAFVTYSDVTVMDDGTVEAFAASQDLSQYSATADVQMDTTVTMPDGSTLYGGGWSPHGFVMVNIPLSIDAGNSDGIYTISSSHELNWPGCDGYGTIVATSILFEVASIGDTTALPPLATCTCSSPIGPDSTGKCSYSCACGPKAGTVTYNDIQGYYTWYMAQQPSCQGMAPNSCPAVVETHQINIRGLQISEFSKCIQIKPN